MYRNDPPTAEHPLPLEDVRQIVRLLAGLAVLPVSLNGTLHALVADMAGLVDADDWVWGVAQRSESGRQPDYACIVRGGFTGEQSAMAL